jgi:Yip1 domain
MESNPQPPVLTGPEMGTVERLTGVFFSPGKTFESIGRKPGWDWLVPVAIMLCLVLFGAFMINPKLDVDGAVNQAMKKFDQRKDLNDAQRENIEKSFRGQYTFMTTGKGRYLAPVIVIIPLLLVPLFYHGIAAAFGAATRYGTVLAGYAWVQMVQVVKGLIGIAVTLPRDKIDILDAERIVKSSVGAFLNPETTPKALMALATNIDLFEIWGLVLGSIMLSRTTRLSKNAATMTVVGLWVVWVLVKVAGAALGSAVGG